jgi:predicted RNase H-like nuclease (RuvC/YqgF family)
VKSEHINKHHYKKIEKILYNYNKTKCEIINLQIDIAELKDEVILPSTHFSTVESGKCDSKGTSSQIENEVLKREKKIAILEREIRSKERTIQKVDNALSLLNLEDRVFVQLRYFDKTPINILMRRYNIEKPTIYAKRNTILKAISTFFR